MSNNVIPDEKTMKSVKNVLIIICITLTILIGLIIIVTLAKKVGRVADGNRFEETMLEYGCTVTDETSKYSSNTSYIITSAILAKSPQGSYNIRYVKLYDQDYATQFFNMTKSSYERQKTKGNVVSESFSDDKNNGEYYLTTKKLYIRVERVGTAIFEANGYPENRKEIDALFEKLGL